MMRLITGTPGAGKSLFAVSEIVKAVKDGRTVYTNIEGMDLEGVFPLDDKDWRNNDRSALDRAAVSFTSADSGHL